jgi:hypothetical protein
MGTLQKLDPLALGPGVAVTFFGATLAPEDHHKPDKGHLILPKLSHPTCWCTDHILAMGTQQRSTSSTTFHNRGDVANQAGRDININWLVSLVHILEAQLTGSFKHPRR